MGNGLKRAIVESLREIRTVDCHSHTRLRKVYYEAGGLDLFSLMSYFQRDIDSTSGGRLYEGAETDDEKWRRLKGVLGRSRNVSYWRHNLVVYHELFGLEDAELTDGNWKAMNERIRERSREPSWYDHVTKEVCGLETQVRNIPWFEDWEEEYFTPVLRMEGALRLIDAEARKQLEGYLGVSIGDLKAAKEAVRAALEKYVERGTVGIKLGHAYWRTLHSTAVEESEAARIFGRALKGEDLSPAETKAYQDHMVFFLAELVREKDLVFQIHTGVQTNWGNVPDSDPLHLIPLLKAFPDARFDLFHCGYPYSRMLGMLGKHFPNVWLNMAWMYVISTAASRQILSEWIDLVPGYRLLGFGSDVGFPEMIYGHLVMARDCVADVLAEKVEKDFLSEEEAHSLARRMFRDNPMEFYGLRE